MKLFRSRATLSAPISSVLVAVVIAGAFGLGACSGAPGGATPGDPEAPHSTAPDSPAPHSPAPHSPEPQAAAASDRARGPAQAWFGELHVHSQNSFDAFSFGVRQSPEDAYRYARGEAIDHISGVKIQMKKPIDFMAVTDHAEYMGLIRLLSVSNGPLSSTAIAKEVLSGDGVRASRALGAVIQTLGGNPPVPAPELNEPGLRHEIWQSYVELADRYYEPGVFTTLVGYEWTSSPDAKNLHRNVIFRGREVPALPFSSFDSQNPEELWKWLDALRAGGTSVMAIPHNSNVSDGIMFPLQDSWGRAIDRAYAQTRIRNEPLVEITQIKGSSETHPSLSPNDEWADFEILDTLLGGAREGRKPGSYARDAYLRGLRIRDELGVNPYQFGLIGASDSHNSSVPVEEHNYTGKIGTADGTAKARLGGSLISPKNLRYGASGLAGVWAAANTREEIYDALARKEVFATSGPRIAVRLFASRLEEDAHSMGAELPSDTREIHLRIEARRDPDSAPQQRIQLVKGWLDANGLHERVFDIACSDGGVPDPDSRRCPDNRASIDVSDCAIPEETGDAQLEADWRDDSFDPDQHAFWYARVLENPSCRWSTWDALRNGWPLPEGVPATIQERAWTSPVWYAPSS